MVYDDGSDKCDKNTGWYWCECGNSWGTSTHIHDVSCSACGEVFMDNHIEVLTEREFDDLDEE